MSSVLWQVAEGVKRRFSLGRNILGFALNSFSKR